MASRKAKRAKGAAARPTVARTPKQVDVAELERSAHPAELTSPRQHPEPPKLSRVVAHQIRDTFGTTKELTAETGALLASLMFHRDIDALDGGHWNAILESALRVHRTAYDVHYGIDACFARGSGDEEVTNG